MNHFLRKLLVFICLLTVSFSSFATEVLTLDQLRKEVLDENIDVKIQYEKYYQSQQNVRVKLGEFLPSLNFQLLYWNSTYSLLYSLVPTPSGWFEYDASKELAIAEKFVTDSIKLNILRDLTLSFINVKHQEKMRESLIAEENLLKEAVVRAQNQQSLGMGTDEDTFTANRALMQHQQQIFALDQVIEVEKEALYLAIDREPTSDFNLAEVTLNSSVLPATVEEAIDMALMNAPELKANTFMAEAARYMTQSARWSFISFSGIGFGYPSALRIEKSRARVIALKAQQIENEISNQVAFAYKKLENYDLRITNQKDLVVIAEENLAKVRELYEGGQATLEELIKAQNALMVEQRSLVTLKMEKKITIANTKRLLGLDASLNSYDTTAYENVDLAVTVNHLHFGKKSVSVDIMIDDSLKDQIVSVVYEGDIFDKRVLNITGNLSLYRKVKMQGAKTVKATILLVTGEKVELITSVNL